LVIVFLINSFVLCYIAKVYSYLVFSRNVFFSCLGSLCSSFFSFIFFSMYYLPFSNHFFILSVFKFNILYIYIIINIKIKINKSDLKFSITLLPNLLLLLDIVYCVPPVEFHHLNFLITFILKNFRILYYYINTFLDISSFYLFIN
jgi:hypothetical protein